MALISPIGGELTASGWDALLSLDKPIRARRNRASLGVDNLTTLDEVAAALLDLCRQRPAFAAAVVKLNEGVSGEGNALVDLTDLAQPNESVIKKRLRSMQFERAGTKFDDFGRNPAGAAESWRNA